jgi:hypothetical protein
MVCTANSLRVDAQRGNAAISTPSDGLVPKTTGHEGF